MKAGGRFVEDVQLAPAASCCPPARPARARSSVAAPRRRRVSSPADRGADSPGRPAAGARAPGPGCGWRWKRRQGLVHGPLAARRGSSGRSSFHVEHLALEPAAAADLAGHEHVGQEHHLDLHVPRALARLAAAARHVERERAGRVASARGPAAARRTVRAARRMPSRRSPGWSAACGRWATDRSSTTSASASHPSRPRTSPTGSPRCSLALWPPCSRALELPVEHVVDQRGSCPTRTRR